MPLNSTTGFPTVSKLIEKKWEERRMRLHAQKIHDVQPLVKTAPPKVYPHMILRLKKIQSEEQKQAEIDKDNQILLQRMTWILKRKGQVDNWNDYRRMSMNKLVREREQQQIAEKNLGIAKKLESVRPYYNVNEWEEEYEKRALLQGQWNKSTKDYESTPRTSMASRRSYESFPKVYLKIYAVTLPPLDKKSDKRGPGSRAKSESTSSSVTKLPKLMGNGSTKYPREYNSPRKGRRRMSSRLSESEEASTSSSKSSSRSSSSNHSSSEQDSSESETEESKAKKAKREKAKKKKSLIEKERMKQKLKEEERLRKQREEKKKQKEEEKRKQKEEEEKRKRKEQEEQKRREKEEEERKRRERDRLKKKQQEEKLKQKQKEEEKLKQKQKEKDRLEEEKKKKAERVKQKEKKQKEEEKQNHKDKDPDDNILPPSIHNSDASESEEEKAYEEEVFDTRRIHSVRKDKRLRSTREDDPRVFSGVMVTERGAADSPDKSSKDKATKDKADKEDETLSDTGGTGYESEFESDGDAMEEDDLEEDEEGLDEDTLVDQDAKLLFRAVKNLSKPEDVVVKTLIRRSPKQRMLTKEKFEELYEMSLGTELKKVLGSAHFTLIDCLLGVKTKSDTTDIHNALKAKDIAKLVDLLSSKSSASLAASTTSYKKDYDVSLEQDIRDKISDEDCQNLLVALLSERPSTETVDEDMAARDAEQLSEAGEGRFSNENGKFILLVKERSPAQLTATLAAYKQLSGGGDINELLEEDGCSKSFVLAVKALDKSAGMGSSQWAEHIHAQLKPNNADLISTMLDRNDQEMTSIRKSYRKKYAGELTDDIVAKCGTAGPLIAHVAARGGVTPAPGAKQPRPPPGEKPKRVNGMRVPSPPRKAPLKGFEPKSPEFGKDNPFQEPQKRPIGDHIRQNAKEKLDKKPPPNKGNKTDRDAAKKKTPTKAVGKAGKGYNADEDVKKIKEAMKGWGTDEEPLIQIFSGRTNEQRQQIRKKYQEKYKSDLLEDLKAELSGDLEEAVLALMMAPGEYDAYCLNDALTGAGTSEAVLIGILSTRNAKELKSISAHYEQQYDESLVDAIESDTSGALGELLGRLIRGERDQSSSVDQELVDQDAEELYQDGATQIKLDDETFKDVMTRRNRHHVRAVFDKYKKLSGRSIDDVIKNSFAGDAEDGYLGLAQAIQSPSDFYANRIHSAMAGVGTNDQTLIRILVSRSEVDLADIKARYKALYKQTLDEAVDDECTGDYKKLLLALIKDKGAEKPKPNPPRKARSQERRDGSRDRRPSPAVSKASTVSNQSKGKTAASPKPARKAEAKKDKTPKKEKPSPARKPVKNAPLTMSQQKPVVKSGEKAKDKDSKKKPKAVSKENDLNKEENKNADKIAEVTREEEVEEERLEKKDDETEDTSTKGEEKVEKERQLLPRPPTATTGTITEDPDADVNNDVTDLEKALAGWNNDEDALIGLLSRRTSKQRLALRIKYEEKHSKELLAVIRSELKGDFEEVVVQMLSSPHELLAKSLHDSIESITEDNCLLNGLLALGSKKEIDAVNSKYSEVFKTSFLTDVKEGGAQAAYVNILEDMLCGSRDQTYDVDVDGGKQDAVTLYNEGEHALKLRDDTFKALLTKANRSQVRLVCDEFKKLAEEDIVEGIKWAMIGDSEDAILGLVRCLRDPVTYFAEHLHDSMAGLGTNDTKLISIIVSRSEIDLQDIKGKYKELYSKDLAAAVSSECSGDYKKMLLAVLSGGDTTIINGEKEQVIDEDTKLLGTSPVSPASNVTKVDVTSKSRENKENATKSSPAICKEKTSEIKHQNEKSTDIGGIDNTKDRHGEDETIERTDIVKSHNKDNSIDAETKSEPATNDSIASQIDENSVRASLTDEEGSTATQKNTKHDQEERERPDHDNTIKGGVGNNEHVSEDIAQKRNKEKELSDKEQKDTHGLDTCNGETGDNVGKEETIRPKDKPRPRLREQYSQTELGIIENEIGSINSEVYQMCMLQDDLLGMILKEDPEKNGHAENEDTVAAAATSNGENEEMNTEEDNSKKENLQPVASGTDGKKGKESKDEQLEMVPNKGQEGEATTVEGKEPGVQEDLSQMNHNKDLPKAGIKSHEQEAQLQEDDLLQKVIEENQPKDEGIINEKEAVASNEGNQADHNRGLEIDIAKTDNTEPGSEPSVTGDGDGINNGSQLQNDLLQMILNEDQEDRVKTPQGERSQLTDDLLQMIIDEDPPKGESIPKVQEPKSEDLPNGENASNGQEPKSEDLPHGENASNGQEPKSEDLPHRDNTSNGEEPKSENLPNGDNASNGQEPKSENLPNGDNASNGQEPKSEDLPHGENVSNGQEPKPEVLPKDTPTVKSTANEESKELKNDLMNDPYGESEEESGATKDKEDEAAANILSGIIIDNSPEANLGDNLLELILDGNSPLPTERQGQILENYGGKTKTSGGIPNEALSKPEAGIMDRALSSASSDVGGGELSEDLLQKVLNGELIVDSTSSSNPKDEIHVSGNQKQVDQRKSANMDEDTDEIPESKDTNNENEGVSKSIAEDDVVNPGLQDDLLQMILAEPTEEVALDTASQRETAEPLDDGETTNLGDVLMGMILNSDKGDTSENNGEHCSDGKDEGIEVDAESKEESSDGKDGGVLQVDEGKLGSEQAEGNNIIKLGNAESKRGDGTPVKTPMTEGSPNVESGSAHVHRKDSVLIDSGRPSDPMCSNKQEEMEKKSNTVRKDTVDNMNPEMLQKLNLEMKKWQPDAAVNAEFLEEENGEEGGAEGNDGDEDVVERNEAKGDKTKAEADDCAVGMDECTSTDDEVPDNELYGDDWDDELVAVVDRRLDRKDTVTHMIPPEDMININQDTVGRTKKQNNLKIEEISLGGDSGIGNGADDIGNGGGKIEHIAVDTSIDKGVVHSLVETIIENSVNEYTSHRSDVNAVGNT